MKLLYIVVAIFFLTFLAYIGGYSMGRNFKGDFEYKADLFILSQGYGQLYNMCEAKYQAGVDGDVPKAFRIKGQMDEVLKNVRSVEQKYQEETSTTSNYQVD